jgi:ketosteroid isomerase-like protein
MSEQARSVDELHELFIRRVNAQDLDGLIDLYELDCVFADLDGMGNEHSGHGPLRDFLGGFLAITSEFSATHHKGFVCGDLALLSLSWHAVFKSGGEGTGISAEVARRQADGSWKFVIDEPNFIR